MNYTLLSEGGLSFSLPACGSGTWPNTVTYPLTQTILLPTPLTLGVFLDGQWGEFELAIKREKVTIITLIASQLISSILTGNELAYVEIMTKFAQSLFLPRPRMPARLLGVIEQYRKSIGEELEAKVFELGHERALAGLAVVGSDQRPRTQAFSSLSDQYFQSITELSES